MSTPVGFEQNSWKEANVFIVGLYRKFFRSNLGLRILLSYYMIKEF